MIARSELLAIEELFVELLDEDKDEILEETADELAKEDADDVREDIPDDILDDDVIDKELELDNRLEREDRERMLDIDMFDVDRELADVVIELVEPEVSSFPPLAPQAVSRTQKPARNAIFILSHP